MCLRLRTISNKIEHDQSLLLNRMKRALDTSRLSVRV
jgi:hypothetical protein